MLLVKSSQALSSAKTVRLNTHLQEDRLGILPQESSQELDSVLGVTDRVTQNERLSHEKERWSHKSDRVCDISHVTDHEVP